jgi:hypothetical protein
MRPIVYKVLALLLLLTVIVSSGCGPPIATRLVTVKLEKPLKVELGKVNSIGVLPFNSPNSVVGRNLAELMVKELGHGPLEQGPFETHLIKAPANFKPEAEFLRKLGNKAMVEALLLGEITEFSVQASRNAVTMLAVPKFGPGDPSKFGWEEISEQPSIKDAYYCRIKARQGPDKIEISISTITSSMTVQLWLIELHDGSTLWEKKISRNFARTALPGSELKTEGEVNRMIASIVEEVVSQLKPQELSSQRILRVPHFTMAPSAAKWVRRGIRAAAEDNWLEAERLFLQAMKEVPDECTVNGNLGVAYEKNGRLLEAIAAYERAYRCRPKDPTYRYYSDDLQTAFVPDLQLEDLPTIVLGVRGDGMLYLSAGKNSDRRTGQQFTVYRTEVVRDLKGSQIKRYKEIEIAQGRIVEAKEGMSTGQLLLYNPTLEVHRGDLVRLQGN